MRHFVMTSDVHGVFNFGGDLSLFVLLIRAVTMNRWDVRPALRRSGVVDGDRFADGVHTTVLVQGDTLGGGLESVISFHKVIFERSAQAGFPEVLFNLFPGMGAWNFVIRKAGFSVANDTILSGPPLHRRATLSAAPGRHGRRQTARAKRRSNSCCSSSTHG